MEPRSSRNTFSGILVLDSWSAGGDLIKYPLVKKQKGDDFIKYPPLSLGTKIIQKTVPGILVLGSWFLGGDLIKSPLVKKKKGEI